MRFVFDNFVLDREQRVLWKEGDAVPLSPKVFETLDLLVQNGGRIVTKREFMEKLWPDSFVEDGNLTQNIFVLRKLLGSSENGRPYIETFPRRGYRFVGAVQREEDLLKTESPGAMETAPATGLPDFSGEAALAEALPGPVEIPLTSGPAATHPLTKLLGLVAASILIVLLAAGAFFALRWRTRIRVGGFQRITNDGRLKDLLNTPGVIVESGSTLYFNEVSAQRSVLAHVLVDGGEVSHEPMLAANVRVVGLQPSGRGALLLGSNWPHDTDQSLLSTDISTGAVSNVFDIHAQDASWSPDGRELAYAQLGNLYVRSADGKTVLVASVPGVVFWPRWSPDGRVLRFSDSYQGYHTRLWQVDSAGGNLHQLFANQSDSDYMCCGSWTASGRGFVYRSFQTNDSRIHVRPEGGSWWSRWAEQSIDISSAPLDQWTAPIPSADGRHIFAIGEELHGQLVRIDPVTRRPQPYLGGLSAEGVSFSPDQANIVWTDYPKGTLWRSRSDGSGRVQLTQAPLLSRFPHWSPDGSTIVFIAARPGSDWQLYTVPANGGECKPLVLETRGQGVATWSPDGKALAFGHILNVTEARKQSMDIEVFHLGDRSVTSIPGSAGLWTARWSPDGRFLSAVTEDNQTLRLYDTQTRTWTDLAHSNINDVVWAPDSKSIFFDTSLSADPTLYQVTLNDRKLEVWASLKDFRRASFFGAWLGIAPDGSPIMLEDTSIQELYSISLNLP